MCVREESSRISLFLQLSCSSRPAEFQIKASASFWTIIRYEIKYENIHIFSTTQYITDSSTSAVC